jgi:uncharacterized RDD family membrane protein YckC
VVLYGRVTPPRSAVPGRLVSGDAVELDVRLARLGSRLPARLIDLVVQIALTVVLWLVASFGLTIAGGVDEALVAAVATVILTITFIGYPAGVETLTRGRTVGKLVLGLRVVRDDGGPVRFRHGLTRALVGFAIEFPGLLAPLTWLCSAWVMMANPSGKRLGDLAAGTIVIHDRTPAAWGWVPAMPAPLAGWAVGLDLTGLSDDLALAVRHYLARNRSLREPARSQLGYWLASDVAARISPPPPPGTMGWAFLAAVLAERHRRARASLIRARQATAAVWPELSLAAERRALSMPAPSMPAW